MAADHPHLSEVLRWAPQIALEEGPARTYESPEEQVRCNLAFAVRRQHASSARHKAESGEDLSKW